MELVEKVKGLIPKGAQVTLLGDGEFDGINLQALVSRWDWNTFFVAAQISLFSGEEKSSALGTSLISCMPLRCSIPLESSLLKKSMVPLQQ